MNTPQNTLNQIDVNMNLLLRQMAALAKRTARIETRLCAMADMLGLADELNLNVNEPQRERGTV